MDIKSNRNNDIQIKGLMTITWLMLSFLIIPWALYAFQLLYFISALVVTGLIVFLLIPIFLLVYKYKKTVSYHTETLRLIYSRFQEENQIKIPTNMAERRSLILNHIDDIMHHLNITINEIESYRLRLRVILDSLPLGLIVINDDDEISYINQKSIKIFRIEDTFIHKKLEAINLPEEMIKIVNNYKKELSYNQEYTYNKNTFQVRINQIRFKKLHSKPYLLITLEDISLEKSTERIKKDFFSYASHELKSPLTAIKGYTELVQFKMLNGDEYDQALMSIINQVDLMDHLVDDMLMLSKLEEPQSLNIQHTQANEVLEQVLETLKPMSSEKNIVIDKSLHMISVKIEKLDLNKMFKNVIENAIKYSEKDKKIEIYLHQIEKTMMFKVVDQGSGIQEHHQERIFERFYRVEKDRPTKGTGLGLAIVKHIVLKYKGDIKLQSKIGVGTTIEIQLPV